MENHLSNSEIRALTDESRAIWNAKATFWDERMGEGNAFQRILIGPSVERMLGRAGGRARAGCGLRQRRHDAAAGVARGARHRLHFSEVFIERARARTPQDLADRVSYLVVDATNGQEQLLALGVGDFDAIVCNQRVHGPGDHRAAAARRPPAATS